MSLNLYNHTRLTLVAICFCLFGKMQYTSAMDNCLHYGTGTISISFDKSIATDSIDVTAITSSIFNDPFEEDIIHFTKKDNNTFTCQVPLETQTSLIGISVDTPDRRLSIGLVEIHPDIPLVMEAYFDSDGLLMYSKSDHNGFNRFDMAPTENNKIIIVSDMLMRFASYHLGLSESEPQITSSDYNSWETVSQKLDSLYDTQISYAINGREIPAEAEKLLENNFKYFFAANWRMHYKERAEKTFNIPPPIDNPPVEYYTFLNDIDFSDALLNHTPIFGPYFLLKKMLQKLELGEPIGDTSIQEWQHSLKRNLKPIIPEPTQLLLDMLSATSYIMQLKDNNTPLSPIQIENLNSDFDKNLRAIILSRSRRSDRTSRP